VLRLIGIGIIVFSLNFNMNVQNRPYRLLGLKELHSLCAGEKDKVIIINFWASWCGPCMEELPYFKKLRAEVPSARIVLINLDFEKEVDQKVIPLIAAGQYAGCEIYRLNRLNADDWMPVVDPDWSGAIPATLILAGGKKKLVEQKFENFNSLKTAILQL